jgi:transcriptional regulator with XRE-family HTH domain
VLLERERLRVEPAREFAQQLRTLREAQGLSIRELADLVGVSSVTVWKWEKGGSKPRARLIPPLAKALDVMPVSLGSESGRSETRKSRVTFQKPKESKRPVREAKETVDAAGSRQPEALANVIARAKQMIADASGASPNSITIVLEY